MGGRRPWRRMRMLTSTDGGASLPGVRLRLCCGVETLLVLVTFRRFVQFPENQPQADCGDEKACRHDHSVDSSRICTIVGRVTPCVPINDCGFPVRGIRFSGELPRATVGMGSTNLSKGL